MKPMQLIKKYVADYEQERQNVYLDVKSAYINLMNSHNDSIGVSKIGTSTGKRTTISSLPQISGWS